MERSVELLSHYRCEECGQWFSIGDAPADLKELYCPRCGFRSEIAEAVTGERDQLTPSPPPGSRNTE